MKKNTIFLALRTNYHDNYGNLLFHCFLHLRSRIDRHSEYRQNANCMFEFTSRRDIEGLSIPILRHLKQLEVLTKDKHVYIIFRSRSLSYRQRIIVM